MYDLRRLTGLWIRFLETYEVLDTVIWMERKTLAGGFVEHLLHKPNKFQGIPLTQ